MPCEATSFPATGKSALLVGASSGCADDASHFYIAGIAINELKTTRGGADTTRQLNRVLWRTRDRQPSCVAF